MIKLLGPIPQEHLFIAFSGGIDSVVAANFFARTRKITCVYFDHGTEHGEDAFKFTREYASNRGWGYLSTKISGLKPNFESKEEFWRNERYKFFDSIDAPIITAHHLDDCVETYLFSSMHGTAKTIPYKRNNVIRPFLLTRKTEITKFATHRNLSWIDDPSNDDTDYMRNLIRKEMIPVALKVNPGLHKVVARKVQGEYDENEKI